MTDSKWCVYEVWASLREYIPVGETRFRAQKGSQKMPLRMTMWEALDDANAMNRKEQR